MNRRLAPWVMVLMVTLALLPATSLIPTASAQPAEPDAAQAPVLAYATRDAEGVWSFSDIPDPAARAIPLPQSESIGLSSEELIAQMLDVAATLETARHAREDRRATQSTSMPTTPAQPPAAVTEQRIYAPYGYPPQRHHRRSPLKPEPEPQPPERKKPPERKNQKIRFPTDF